MKPPVGPLGLSAEELAEFARTGKLPGGAAEAPRRRADNDSSLPKEPDGALLEAVLNLWMPKRPRRGAKSKLGKDIVLARQCLNETGGNVEQARARFIVEQTGKRLTDLTPEERSVVSKRFTRAKKEIHKFGTTNWRGG